MALLEIIKSRHSIRKYIDKQVERKDLELILEAGNYAPNAGGGQRSRMVAIQNKELVKKLGINNTSKFNRSNLAGRHVSTEQPSIIDDPTKIDGFYGAPTVVAVFSQKNFLYKTADAFCMIENMVLQATELGISSCVVARGEETFDSDEGREILKNIGISNDYVCEGFVILGYIDGETPTFKPRKENRIMIIE